MMNALWFTILGISSGVSTMISGYLFGRAGESFTKRLRISLFANIVKQVIGHLHPIPEIPNVILVCC